ncbi:sensor histidine kinase [Nocardiopsis potens]|uniref:sensor histidine kinase n=1 Tax=Nocardiopsis potens TaxID=1246458 RepID=UPI000346CECA|nr:histidine kinase [Nocardiopsis potens]
MPILVITLVGLAVPLFFGHPTVATPLFLALQLVNCLPRTRRLRGRWTLAAQVALFPWSEPKGFLAASVLLIVPGRLRWPVFGAVAAAAGLLSGTGFTAGVSAAGNTVIVGLIVFGLTRLSDLRSELHATRRELAAQSVAEERDRISRDLDAVLGSALSAVIGLAGKGRAAEIATLARDAAARIRQAPMDRPARVRRADMTPRLALPVVLSGLAVYVAGALLFMLADPGPATAAGSAIVLAVVGVHVYHLLPRGPERRHRHAAWTLPLQTGLALVPLVRPEVEIVHSLVALAAASALIAVPGRAAAWTLFTTIVLSELLVLLATKDAPLIVVLVASVATVSVAMMLYGLALLTLLVAQVHEARLALAAIAAAEERRRIAADVHDLLGYGLSAIIVKAELAAREPDRADAEFRDIARTARGALADLRAVPYDDPEVSLHVEAASAREVLTAAGVDVRLDIGTGLLDDRVDALLATVLREAVTNVLRHSRARTATIRAVSTGAGVHLRVANDGVCPAPAGGPGGARAARPGGSGIPSLTARVAAAGGELTAGPVGDGGYELTVSHPAARGARPGRPAEA